MSPSQYPQEVYNMLYTDEAGEVIGLDEVQLLEPIPGKRIPKLIALLDSEDAYLAYQCSLILGAWGVAEGIAYLQYLVEARVDKIAEFELHRFWGEDKVYDVISEALGAAILSGYDRNEVISIIKTILLLYGECYFESKLKRLLFKLNDLSLLPDIKRAVELALAHKRYYQASQLLPVLTKYDKPYALAQVNLFQRLISQDDRIGYNIEEMQTYLD